MNFRNVAVFPSSGIMQNLGDLLFWDFWMERISIRQWRRQTYASYGN